MKSKKDKIELTAAGLWIRSGKFSLAPVDGPNNQNLIYLDFYHYPKPSPIAGMKHYITHLLLVNLQKTI